jgi:hypothetical protein
MLRAAIINTGLQETPSVATTTTTAATTTTII